LQRFRRAARVILVSNSAMPVDKPVEHWQLPAPPGPNLRLQRFKRATSLVLYIEPSTASKGLPIWNSVLNHPRSEAYIQSTAFHNDMLPVDTAQCDNIFGFGNFTRQVFDVDPNMRKCHLLGEQLQFFLFLSFL
jgi:hypothetical protein